MLIFSFLLSLLPFTTQIFVYGASLPILAFIPCIALALLKRTLAKSLFFAGFLGLLLDLYSADPFGVHALNYTLTTAFCCRGKSLFSLESPLQFSLYTALCSFVSTTLHIPLLFLFDRRVFFQGKWWLTQWMLLPGLDALYALIWFAGPIALFYKIHRGWTVYWLKKKNPFPNSP